ncbi:MAG: DUF1178 family protein [Hyphomicrobiaceae bacterium]
MIRYRLQCHKKHEFEAWFQTGAAYDRQVERGEVRCPDCASAKVSKTLMAPNVTKRGRKTETKSEAAAPDPEAAKRHEFMTLMRKLRREVEQNAEYVGPRFAQEARKIHYEDVAPRGIYGEATGEDVKELHEEGIRCLPLPRLPDDLN